jgi:hypothetical protein
MDHKQRHTLQTLFLDPVSSNVDPGHAVSIAGTLAARLCTAAMAISS